ncbi:MAG TPA: Rv3654c family TadE-like protein [Pilimelia sp.]|nr:Rv3654c family TadE-like protein [Pilimelia sp.]
MGGTPYGRDRGAASLWLLVVGLVVVAGGIAGAAIGAAVVARHEARTAADLGALAGAAWAVQGPESACARSAVVVTANRGRLASCRIDGLDVVVAVEVTVSPLPGLARTATASARAGPVRATASGGAAAPRGATLPAADQVRLDGGRADPQPSRSPTTRGSDDPGSHAAGLAAVNRQRPLHRARGCRQRD